MNALLRGGPRDGLELDAPLAVASIHIPVATHIDGRCQAIFGPGDGHYADYHYQATEPHDGVDTAVYSYQGIVYDPVRLSACAG